MKKLILITLLLSSMIQALLAATVSTNKLTYALHEQVHVHFTNMIAKNKDWIAIYPKGSSNAWVNVIGWRWTDDKENGDIVFGNGALPVGSYEVRAFYNNSFHTEATKAFKVVEVGGQTTVTTNKVTYKSNENIIATYRGTSDGEEDWIAIYPKNSSNAWANVIEWQWIRGKVNGDTIFSKLPVGEYEVRVFFNNSFHDEAKKAFSVSNGGGTTITTNKAIYTNNDNITATYKGTTNGEEDWIAIYPKNSSNAWANVIEWRWIRGKVNGNTIFSKLPVGEYEVRVFFNNSFHDEAKKAFSVFRINQQRDVYLIQGQSNAFATRGDSLPLNNRVKSFGRAGSHANLVKNDLNWYTAQANSNPVNLQGFIGKWGMKMSSDIANSLDMPLVILNGAVDGTYIDQHLRDNAKPENLNTIYGRLLYRAKKANIANDARVLFWYQGENDGTRHTSIAVYKERFGRLYNSWKNDYKNLEKIYMFQVRSGCGNPVLIMEAQREIANEYDDVIMMSTTGTDTETLADNCHYTLKGYNELAIRMERLVKDDLYHNAQNEAHPPEVESIKFINNRNSVILKLKEAQNLQMVGNPKKDFIVENSNVKVTSISILNKREIRLNFSNALANNAKLTYFGHRGSENSWIQNSNKVGLITFYSMSIKN